MISTNLMVAIPWMAFGLSLAAICLRLCVFRHVSGRSRGPEPRQPAGDPRETSATTSEATGNDNHQAAASPPAQPSQAQPAKAQSAQAQSAQAQSAQAQSAQAQSAQAQSSDAQSSPTQR
jgi:hypothetical protein